LQFLKCPHSSKVSLLNAQPESGDNFNLFRLFTDEDEDNVVGCFQKMLVMLLKNVSDIDLWKIIG